MSSRVIRLIIISRTEIMEHIKSLTVADRKAILRSLAEEFEDKRDAILFDERSMEPDGRPVSAVVLKARRKR